jgi:hypothetical protein
MIIEKIFVVRANVKSDAEGFGRVNTAKQAIFQYISSDIIIE